MHIVAQVLAGRLLSAVIGVQVRVAGARMKTRKATALWSMSGATRYVIGLLEHAIMLVPSGATMDQAAEYVCLVAR